MTKSTAKLKDQARTHELKEEWDRAIQLYVQVLQIGKADDDPELGLYNRIGDLYLKVNRPADAVKYYEEAADLYAEQGLYNNAIALCNKALRYLPSRLELLRKLGQFSAAQGFLTDARRWFLEFAEKAMKGGKKDQAFAALEEFAGVAEDAEVRELLGRQLKAHNRPGDAVLQLKQAYALYISNGATDRASELRAEILALEPGADLGAPPTASRSTRGRAGALPGFEEPPPPERPAEADTIAGMLETDVEPDAAADAVAGFEIERTSEPPVTGGRLDDLPLLEIDTAAAEFEPLAGFEGRDELEAEDEDEGEDEGEEGWQALAEGDEEEDLAVAEADEDNGAGAYTDELPLLADDAEEAAAPDDLPLLEDDAEQAADEDQAAAETGGTFELGELDLAGGSASYGFQLEPLEPGQAADEEPVAGGLDLGSAFELPTESAPRKPATPPARPVRATPPIKASRTPEAPPAPPERQQPEPPEPPPPKRAAPPKRAPAAAEAAAADADAADELSAATAVRRARALLQEGDEAAARAELDGAADALGDDGQVEEAVKVLTELTGRWPDDINAQQRRVEHAFRLGRKDLLVPAYLALAAALARSGAQHKAVAVYQRVLDLDPQNADARAVVTPASERRKERGREAERAAGDYVDLGNLLQDEEEFGDSTRFVVPEAEPSGDEERDFADMLSQFKTKVAEHLAKEDWTSHYDLGLAYKDMGLVDEAIAEFQVALRGGGERLKVYEELGQCFILKKQFNIAVKLLNRGLQMPFDDEADLVGVYYQLGVCYEGLGRTDEARESYERVLSLDVAFRDVNDRLARL